MTSRPSRPLPPRSLAALAAVTLAPAFGRFGFDEAGLITGWADIVGAALAARCRPLRLHWPRAGAAGREGAGAAVLVVGVEGPFAIELQHQAPLVIERVNQHVGWRCVGRLALRQGPLPRPPVAPARSCPCPAARAAAAATVAAIPDEPLRTALQRLGAHVLHASRPGSAT